ncbi:GATA zinc finger domain-containing protein 1 [Uranotaenia lowii]|uniref:GATA zinc finger domain-containing protein 1 n=1 Tax=Uranotaenia lowii TaxID=190385 RepID=UPI0024793456|nr:GATA zinc finger domain-containing protein 1 [Uranotaenia lowii]
MPPKPNARCSQCQSFGSEKWHTVERGVLICAACHEKQEREQKELEQELREIQAIPPLAVREAAESITELGQQLLDMERRREAAARAASAVDSGKKEAEEDKAAMEVEVKEEDDKEGKDSNEETKPAKPVPALSPRKLRKNVRSRKGGASGSGGNGAKGGRSRRFIFKSKPMKAPTITVTTRTVDSLFYNNIYIQIGDIVSVMDPEDNIYYAQIHGLQIDSYCEKSAYITWLLPTSASPEPNERFDPSTYVIGPSEDFARKLSYMEFVMHAPSNYYLDRNNPYPRPDSWGPENSTQKDNSNFVWTNIAHLH